MEPVEGYPIGIPLPYFPSCAYLVFKYVVRNFQLLYADGLIPVILLLFSFSNPRRLPG